MALVSLGIRNPNTGGLPVPFDSFPYNERKAYRMELVFGSADFGNIFSSIRLQAILEPTNALPIMDWRNFTFDIVSDRIFFFYPLNRLVDGNGDCTFQADRIPLWRGGGDGEPVSLELLYDDSNDINSWID